MTTIVSPKFELLKDRVFISLSCLSFVLFLYILCLPLNHDAAWLFQTSFLWLEGKEFGVDIVGPNPPMMLWLGVPAALFSKMTSLSAALTLKIYFMTLIFIVFAYFYSFALSYLKLSKDRLMILGATFVFLFVFMPGYHFGQREHIAALLILPYLLTTAFMDKPISKTSKLFAGISGAIAIAFKPHFVLIPILVELVALISHRKFRNFFRIDSLTLGFGLVFYVLAILLTSPKYFTDVLPTMLWVYSHYEGSSYPTFHASAFGLISVISIIQVFQSKTHLKLWSVLFAAALGFAIVALHQNKGWDYHWLPAHILIILSFTLCIKDYIKPNLISKIGIPVTITLMIMISSFIPWIKSDTADDFSPKNTKLRVEAMMQVINRYSDQSSYVYAFTTSPRDIHPAVLKTGVKWPEDSCALVFAPVSIKSQEQDLSNEQKQRLAKEDEDLIENISKNNPKVVFVQTHGRLALSDSDTSFLDHFHQYSEFKQFWASYSKIDRIGNYDVYINEAE